MSGALPVRRIAQALSRVRGLAGDALAKVLGAVVALAAVVGLAPAALAAPLSPPIKPLQIQPGPAAIGEQERAIVADPARGIEHAVILLEEIDRDEPTLLARTITYHLRAKVLSAEGRALGDVEIPYNVRLARVTKWWGRTILPDGRVLELPQSGLSEQMSSVYKGSQTMVLRGALPGVEPGAIIDYGYTVVESSFDEYAQIPLERRFALREFRMRIRPCTDLDARYEILHGEGRDIKGEFDGSAFLITARDLKPVAEEPLMPALEEVRASLVFYYPNGPRNVGDWWDERSRIIERYTARFLSRAAVTRMMEAMALPEGSLDARLRAAYDWINANLQIDELRTVEEAARDTSKDEDEKNTLAYVLEQKHGDTRQIARAFLGVARQLGAEASLVFAPDRTRNYWSPQLLSLWQIPNVLVAVGPPGAPESARTVVAPGSGLPFGQVPWWLTGVPAFVAAKAGAQQVTVPMATAADSAVETTVSLAFGEDNASLTAHWTRTAGGQFGYLERRSQRQWTPDERRQRNETLCGASATLEVDSATLAGIENLRAPYRLECSAVREIPEITPETTSLSVAASGPWLVPLPDLTAPQRVHPVVFDYPYSDRTVLTIEAPPGFKPGPPPPPFEQKNGALNFTRTVTATETGFRIERTFVSTTLMVPVENYRMLLDWLAAARRADDKPLVFVRSEK